METSNALKNSNTYAMSVSITSYSFIKTKPDKLAISSIMLVLVQLLFGYNIYHKLSNVMNKFKLSPISVIIAFQFGADRSSDIEFTCNFDIRDDT